MKKIIVISIVAVFLFIPFFVSAADSKGNLSIQITGFSSDEGEVLVTLFTSKDGFPTEADKAHKKLTGHIKNGKSHVVINDISYGEYAVAVLHDENKNGKMDRSIFGMPKEGNGASNNPESSGPPKFEDAKFSFNSNISSIDINLKYIE